MTSIETAVRTALDTSTPLDERIFTKLLSSQNLAEYTRNVVVRQLAKSDRPNRGDNARKLLALLIQRFPSDIELKSLNASLSGTYRDQSVLLRNLKDRTRVVSTMDTSVTSTTSLFNRLTRDLSPERGIVKKNFARVNTSYVSDVSPVYRSAVYSPRRILASSSSDEDEVYRKRPNARSVYLTVEKELEIAKRFRTRKWFSGWNMVIMRKRDFGVAIARMDGMLTRWRTREFFQTVSLLVRSDRLESLVEYNRLLELYLHWRGQFDRAVSGRREQVQGVSTLVGFLVLILESRKREFFTRFSEFSLREKCKLKAAKKLRGCLTHVIQNRTMTVLKEAVLRVSIVERHERIFQGTSRIENIFRHRISPIFKNFKNEKFNQIRQIAIKGALTRVTSILTNNISSVFPLLQRRVKMAKIFHHLSHRFERRSKMYAVKRWTRGVREERDNGLIHGAATIEKILIRKNALNCQFAILSLRSESSFLENELIEVHSRHRALMGAVAKNSWELRSKRNAWTKWIHEMRKKMKISAGCEKLRKIFLKTYFASIFQIRHATSHRLAATILTSTITRSIRSRMVPFFRPSLPRSTRSEETLAHTISHRMQYDLLRKIFSRWRNQVSRGRLMTRVFTRILQSRLSQSFSLLKEHFWKSEIVAVLRHSDTVVAAARVDAVRQEKHKLKLCFSLWTEYIARKKKILNKLAVVCSGRYVKIQVMNLLYANRRDGSTRSVAVLQLVSVIKKRLGYSIRTWSQWVFMMEFKAAQTEQDRVTRELAEAAQLLEVEFRATKEHNENMHKELEVVGGELEETRSDNQLLAEQLNETLEGITNLKTEIITLREENEILKHRSNDSGEYKHIIDRQRTELERLTTRLGEYSKLHSSVSFYKNKCLLQSEQINSLQSKLRESASSPLISSRSVIAERREPPSASITPTRSYSHIPERDGHVLYSSPVLRSYERTVNPRDITPSRSLRNSRLY
jgi:hypothetical protein